MTKLHPFLDHGRPLAFAHRGGALEAEENTLPAFERAVALGFRHVELDVHLDGDGQVRVHHDRRLTRLFGDSRDIGTLRAADFASLRSAQGAHVPTLGEVLHSFPELQVNIELKCDDCAGPVAEAIRRGGSMARVGVGSAKARRTRQVRALLGPDLAWSPAHLDVVRLLGTGYGLPYAPDFRMLQVPQRWNGLRVVSRRLIDTAHAHGLQVHVWTVNDRAEMEHLLDLGVDGLMSDRPSLLREVLIERGQWA